jgi:release factor glutamine methyltransferase
MTLGHFVAHARATLLAGGVPPDEAAGDAEFLARHALGCDLTQYALARSQVPSPEFPRRFAALIARRVQREPVSQIVGYREFWGLEFEVTRDVLTPRPETELVVEAALEAFPRDAPLLIIDVGTGSGCLAVALAREFSGARVIATDVSEAALDVARRNAARHAVADRIDFRRTDLLEGVTERADLIVSNPPYVASRDAASLPPEVREFEPHIALFAGDDGLYVYRRLLPHVESRLRPGGCLIVEIGRDQSGPVSALAAPRGWHVERARTDLQGITRTMVFRR